MDPERRVAFLTAVRRGVVLSGAAVLALWAAVGTIRERGWTEQPDLAAMIDASVAGLRDGLRPGERIGVAIPAMDSSSELAFWYSAQYALAPALVQPVMLRDCARLELGPRCRVPQGMRIAVLRPDVDTLTFLERRLGLVTIGAAGPTRILARVTR